MAETQNDTSTQAPQEQESHFASEMMVDDQVANNAVEWRASEFVHHDKSSSWYIVLGVVALVVAVLIYLITRDFISVAVIVFGSLLFGIYAGRQPRQLEYRVDNRGVQIGQKYYGFDNFKSFSIASEGAFSSIVFMPLKRFSPMITIYFPPEDEDSIVNILAVSIPYEEYKLDAVDRLMKSIRF